ncbi:MAG: glycosyltransferase [Candidatus Hydrogenedentes bacterium]|nr:glycosyltransferase [Candidatus Hydrogenedentota bacterium]
MNIVMMTNTYLPLVGGVAQSVHRFTTSLRSRGHNVLVVAPTFDGAPETEQDVVRVPAVQNFNGSDFSVILPLPLNLTTTMEDFDPDLFHSHHPFLLGDSALRKAAARQAPIVFTHHTMYEEYVHYVPLEAGTLREFVKELSTGYANLCDHVIAPSESIKDILLERGVTTPISVVPTGVDIKAFSEGDRGGFRQAHNIPEKAFVIGHVGRLAPEKNLEFVAEAAAKFLAEHRGAWLVVVGGGPSQEPMEKILNETGVGGRVVFAGKLVGQQLVDAYHAFDVFAFGSKSETQGMVLVEAMTAGTPVVGLEAPGVREVVRDKCNGRLIREEEVDAFVEGLRWVASFEGEERRQLRDGVLATAQEFSMNASAAKIERVYEQTVQEYQRRAALEFSDWKVLLGRIEREWDLWANRFAAARAAYTE